MLNTFLESRRPRESGDGIKASPEKELALFYEQGEYKVRLEWGMAGLQAMVHASPVVIIVDVLSFCTSVDLVVARGGAAVPYAGSVEELPSFARSVGALCARPGREPGEGYSLAPSSLQGLPPGSKIVLPSPNGSTLSMETGGRIAFAGCLRNAQSVARAAALRGLPVAVIAAGERWPDGSLRPSVEDLLGAGAIISHLPGSRSPEAEVAVAAFLQARVDLLDALSRCASGRELRERGFGEDVLIAAQLDVSQAAPQLLDGAYRQTPSLAG